MYLMITRYGGVRGRGGEGRGERESSEGERTNQRLGILFLIFDFFSLFLFLDITSLFFYCQ